MIDPRWRALLILLLAPLAGTLAGWLSGSALARQNYMVQVAERVWLEESQGLSERTNQSTAFRATGMPPAQLYAQAREISHQFRVGAALFGLWCGVVAACKILGLLAERARREYDADPAACLACTRCYAACPVEQEHRKPLSGEQTP
jgi:ferredoxin